MYDVTRGVRSKDESSPLPKKKIKSFQTQNKSLNMSIAAFDCRVQSMLAVEVSTAHINYRQAVHLLAA